MKSIHFIIFAILSGVITLTLTFSYSKNKETDTTSIEQGAMIPPVTGQSLTPQNNAEISQQTNTVTFKEVNISDHSSLYLTLVKEQVSPQTVLSITKAAKGTYDLSELAPGTRLVLAWSKEKLEQLRVLISGKKELQVDIDGDGDWEASMIEHDIKIEWTAFFGSITSTLWDSAVAAGMPFELISDLSEIFASQVDFTRELDVDDEWSLLVEKQLVGSQEVGYGNILAAKLSKRGEQMSAFRFVREGGRGSYFDEEGKSARGKFIKSPLRYNKITSRFQHTRFHPILKVPRPHKGVDFAAPTGTPVRSVGDGVILEAGRNKGSGIMIKIRHDSRYMTAYKHLSKIASGVRLGSRVEQGQLIGYVGMTGLATGPHLHFEFYEDSRYVDPLGKRFPRKDSLETKYKKRFNDEVKILRDFLEEARVKSRAF
jgi:murein DD-endopeptidase MepM/ murein hydrolase activator NlpD